MRRTIGGRPQSEAPAGAPRRAARSVAVPAPRSLHARPELNDDLVGAYMQDAIGRGGYRAALEYYGSEEAKKSEALWHRLRARGWLLGRLGLYGQVQGWLEEASAWPDFDHLPAAGVHGGRAAYRPSALWLKTPEPARRSAGGLLTIEPAATANPDPCAVPGYIWAAMLILDATGPICLNPCKPPGARRAVVERPLVMTGPRVLVLEWGNPSCCVTGRKSPHR